MATLTCLLYSLTVLTAIIALSNGAIYDDIFIPMDVYLLPDLPYGYNELEPHMDEGTLRVHHQGHHRAYTDKMNTALQQWRKEDSTNADLSRSSIYNIMRNLNDVPTKWRTSLTNNGGGYVNHIFYWATMCPSHSSLPPSLVTAVKESFNGGIEKMKHLFTERAQTLFGSGYVWLVMDKDTNMKIITTKDQDTPMSIDLYPLLVLDVWEHSYYLKHQNKRGNYISDWWNVVCWGKVEDLRIMWLDKIQSDELIQLDANIIQKVDAKEL